MKNAVIIGGSRGLGLAILNEINDQYDKVYVFDIVEPLIKFDNVVFSFLDLSKSYFKCDIDFSNIDALFITAGIGSIKPFKDLSESEINKLLYVNSYSTIKILKCFYQRLLSKDDVKCFAMGSIAGEVVTPLAAVYSAAKSSLSMLIKALNVELFKSGSINRITYGYATAFNGSSFNGGETDIKLLEKHAKLIVYATNNKLDEVALDEELCSDIKKRFVDDPKSFALSSYDYKMNNNRINNRKIITVGYLSGTFDLFHIGHLNILKKAKEQCDYLIVGVHKSGSWKGKETFIPFEERVEILKSIKYVDEVHESLDEDSDAWDLYHYDKLFVGDDYKGTERFKKYEQYFKDKGVEIVYFPYTKGTSSTQIRDKIKKS